MLLARDAMTVIKDYDRMLRFHKAMRTTDNADEDFKDHAKDYELRDSV